MMSSGQPAKHCSTGGASEVMFIERDTNGCAISVIYDLEKADPFQNPQNHENMQPTFVDFGIQVNIKMTIYLPSHSIVVSQKPSLTPS